MAIITFPALINSLIKTYKKFECKIIGGYPSHFTAGNELNLFNYVVKKNKILSTSASLSNDELFTIYNLSLYINPKNIFIIGNSYGISAVFLSLLFPKANLVAIDKYRTKGVAFTNKLLKTIGNSKKAIKGDSPKDINKIINKYFNQKKIDLVLIDGLHTNKAQINDYEGILPFLSTKSVTIFHDVINCNMLESYTFLKKKYNLNSFLLSKTCSGMALSFKSNKINSKLLNYLNYQSDDLATVLKLNKISNQKIKSKIPKKFDKKTKFLIPSHPQK